MIFRTIYT